MLAAHNVVCALCWPITVHGPRASARAAPRGAPASVSICVFSCRYAPMAVELGAVRVASRALARSLAHTLELGAIRISVCDHFDSTRAYRWLAQASKSRPNGAGLAILYGASCGVRAPLSRNRSWAQKRSLV